MAKATVEVKQYKRKDGTVVRGSTRKLTKAEKLKRKQSLGQHLKKGAKVVGGIAGGLGALQGAAYGGAVGGPAGALLGGSIGAASGALQGSVAGATYGAGAYGVKRAMAKKRDKKGFKNYFDYSKENTMIEFARGRDKQKRKKRQNKIGNHIKKGAKITAGIGAVNNAVAAATLAKQSGASRAGVLGAALGGAAGGALTGAASGAIYGGATYGVKKAFAKNRGKENFNYSKNTEGTNMFIGQQDETISINFARKRGSKDKAPRKKRIAGIAAKAGAVAGGVAAIGLAAKNRKGIGSALNAGRAASMRAGYTAASGASKAARSGMSQVKRTAGTAAGTARLGAMAAGEAVRPGMQRVKGAAQGASSAVQGGVSAGVSKLRNSASKFEQRGREVMNRKKK